MNSFQVPLLLAPLFFLLVCLFLALLFVLVLRAVRKAIHNAWGRRDEKEGRLL